MAFSDRLKSLLSAKNIDQKELGKIFGLSKEIEKFVIYYLHKKSADPQIRVCMEFVTNPFM